MCDARTGMPKEACCALDMSLFGTDATKECDKRHIRAVSERNLIGQSVARCYSPQWERCPSAAYSALHHAFSEPARSAVRCLTQELFPAAAERAVVSYSEEERSGGVDES